jgi:hypothetical protein
VIFQKHISKHLLFWAACLSVLWSVYFAVSTISMPYPIEFREGAAQVMTQYILNRTNPFTLENQPQAMNNYGSGYNLVVAPFAVLFGNTLSTHRAVTFAFILFASLIGSVVIYQIKRDVASAFACAAFIMIGLTTRAGIGAFPSAMGTFLFLIALALPFLKAFHPASLGFSILFSIAAFYSKPYFVLAFAIVASYVFLFVSKKTGLLYGLAFLILFVVSFLAVRLAFPLYFINVIIGNISNAERSAAHLLSQLVQLAIYFFPVLFSLLVLRIMEQGSSGYRAIPAFNVQEWEQPWISVAPDYFLYATVCSLLAFILFLGSHIGSYMNYAYQLVVPVFFCWFFLKLDHQRKTNFLIGFAVVFNLFFWQQDVLPLRILKQSDSEEWSKLSSYVQSASQTLNSPVVTSMMVDYGLSPLDSGQTSYYYAIKPYPNFTLLGPAYDMVETDGFRYVKFIDNSIKQQTFDLVITTREKSTFYHVKLLEDFYSPVDEIKVDMPQTGQRWSLLLWRPRTR